MVIIEKEYKIPSVIVDWAQSHSVPIMSYRDADAPSSRDCLKGFNQNEFCLQDNLGTFSLNYDYVIEYSEETSLDYLNMTYCHAHNLPATIVATERFIIREIGIKDLDVYKRIINENPDVIFDKSLVNLSAEEFKERHLAYMKYSYQFLGYGIWGIFLIQKGNNKNTDYAKNIVDSTMIGIAGLDGTDVPQLSYALFTEYQGNGYAFEACDKVLEYAVSQLGLDKVIINIQNDNPKSLILSKKLATKYPLLEIIIS